MLAGQQVSGDSRKPPAVPNSSSPRSQAASLGPGLPPRAHAGSSRDPARLAEQLAAAAGGADVGVVASAAKCLRDYAALEAALTHERQVGLITCRTVLAGGASTYKAGCGLHLWLMYL